jgi:hypothetical protein
MSEARNDTAESADANVAGRHRGQESPDDNETPAHGRHRRPTAE